MAVEPKKKKEMIKRNMMHAHTHTYTCIYMYKIHIYVMYICMYLGI